MAKAKLISLDEVLKSEIAICPECGVLFVKTVKGETGFFQVGIYCPVCESLVVEKELREEEDE